MAFVVVDSQIEGSFYQSLFESSNSCDASNLWQYKNDEEAKAFLMNRAIGSGGHVDCLIRVNREENTHSPISDQLTSWIRESNECFSHKNFKVKSIPIIQIEPNAHRRGGWSHSSLDDSEFHLFDYNLDNFNPSEIVSSVEEAIRIWRKHILKDLRDLQIDLGMLQRLIGNYIDPAYSASFGENANYYSSKLGVLSEDFIGHPRRLKYDWLDNRFMLRSPVALMRYEQIMKGRFTKSDDEIKILHQLYLDFPQIPMRDCYRAYAHELPIFSHKFPKPKRPDFCLNSSVTSRHSNVILETKLPDKIDEKHATIALAQTKKYMLIGNFASSF